LSGCRSNRRGLCKGDLTRQMLFLTSQKEWPYCWPEDGERERERERGRERERERGGVKGREEGDIESERERFGEK
jgi:hypothetical protein